MSMVCQLYTESKELMKILFLTRSLNCGGAERQLVALSRGLSQQGHNVSIAVIYSGGPLEKDLKGTSVRVLTLNKRGRWEFMGFLWRLIKLVVREQADILHTYTDNLFAVAAQPCLPSMKIVWGIRGSEVDFSRYDWLYRVSYRLSCSLSRTADLIISNSHAGRNVHVADGYPEKKVIVIPNGIDTVRFRPDSKGRERVRREWKLTEHDLLIGVVARLDPMKDHDTFLRAASLLLQVRPAAKFVCVGDGPPQYRAALQSRAHELGLSNHVLWAGVRSDVVDVFNALDVLVSSSSFGEGFSNVIGEAMACGVPCVATKVGDAEHIVGELGELVNPNDPVALSAGIQRVLTRELSPDEIRRRIVESFSLVKLTLSTERELLKLCHQMAPTSLSQTQQTLLR